MSFWIFRCCWVFCRFAQKISLTDVRYYCVSLDWTRTSWIWFFICSPVYWHCLKVCSHVPKSAAFWPISKAFSSDVTTFRADGSATVAVPILMASMMGASSWNCCGLAAMSQTKRSKHPVNPAELTSLKKASTNSSSSISASCSACLFPWHLRQFLYRPRPLFL